MRFAASWFALLQLAILEFTHAATPLLRPRDYASREYYAIELSRDVPPDAIAGDLGLVFEGPIGELDHHYLFSGLKGEADVVHEYRRRRKAKRDEGGDTILFSEKQIVKRLEKRSIPPRQAGPRPRFVPDTVLAEQLKQIANTLDIHDPIFHEQWHLFNTVDKEHDVNVTGLWQEGVTGFNSTVAIVDDGLDMYSDDLKGNYVSRGVCSFTRRCANLGNSSRKVPMISTKGYLNLNLVYRTTDTGRGVRERLRRSGITSVVSAWPTIPRLRASGSSRSRYPMQTRRSPSTTLTSRTRFTLAAGGLQTMGRQWRHREF